MSDDLQVARVRRRMLMATHAVEIAELYWYTQMDPLLCIEAFEACLDYTNPGARLRSLWQQWDGGDDRDFVAFVRAEVRAHLRAERTP